MPTAYVGPGWENPERRKMPIGGSLADFYIHDGFTVASVVEAGFIDREQVAAGREIAIFSPIDKHRSTPMTWVRNLAEAEKYIAEQRRFHPDWPTEPVPLAISIPEVTTTDAAR